MGFLDRLKGMLSGSGPDNSEGKPRPVATRESSSPNGPADAAREPGEAAAAPPPSEPVDRPPDAT